MNARVLAIACMLLGSPVAAEILDQQQKAIDTRLSPNEKFGRTAWLDENTVAVTTRLKEFEDWEGRIVAFNVRTRQSYVVQENAFLVCSNPHAGVVSVMKGSYLRMYWPSRASSGSDPEQFSFRWDPQKGALAQEQRGSLGGWNLNICMPTRPQDQKAIALEFLQRKIRYLQPAHGILRWGEEDSADADDATVSLEDPAGTRRAVAVKPTEISVRPLYIRSTQTYVLSAGRDLLDGGVLVIRGVQHKGVPAITMQANGEVTRWQLPAELRAELKRKKAIDAGLLPYARGLLVGVPAWRDQGAGLYTAEGGVLRKVWCDVSSSMFSDNPKCSADDLQLSPDGCKIAFLARDASPATVQVLDLCARGREP